MERRLAAILALDVVGFSRLMAADEAGTLVTLKACRGEIIEPEIDKHGGRIFKLTGDGVLAEFPSVVMAVNCAVAVQRSIYARNASLPEGDRIVFRTGVNIGDVIVDDSDLYGDGVNVAARLESISPSGGLAISSAVYEYLDQKLSSLFVDGGSRNLKNMDRPIGVWLWSHGETMALGPDTTTSGNRDRPRLAVRQFRNLRLQDDSDLLSEGLFEELVTALARAQAIDVISSSSNQLLNDQAAELKEIVEVLDVNYLLEGAIQRAGPRVRISVKLIDCRDQRTVWSDRFDGEMLDLFDFQDEMTQRIVGAVLPQVRSSTAALARRKRPNESSAYELYLQARQLVYRGTREDFVKASDLLRRAISLDPDFPLAQALLSNAITRRYAGLWEPYCERTLDEAQELAHQAISISNGDAEVLALASQACTFNHRSDPTAASKLLHDAIERMPMTGDLITAVGWPLVMLGQVDLAHQLFSRGVSLTKDDASVSYMQAGVGVSLFFLARSAEAVGELEQAWSVNPRLLMPARYLAASYFDLNHLDRCREVVAQIHNRHPELTVSMARTNLKSFRHPRMEIYHQALEAGGLPA